MTNAKLSLNTDTIHYQVRSAVADLCSGVENIRLVATALGDRVGELLITAGAEELRQTAAVVKAHSFGVLASLATLSNKAEPRLRIFGMRRIQNRVTTTPPEASRASRGKLGVERAHRR